MSLVVTTKVPVSRSVPTLGLRRTDKRGTVGSPPPEWGGGPWVFLYFRTCSYSYNDNGKGSRGRGHHSPPNVGTDVSTYTLSGPFENF